MSAAKNDTHLLSPHIFYDQNSRESANKYTFNDIMVMWKKINSYKNNLPNRELHIIKKIILLLIL